MYVSAFILQLGEEIFRDSGPAHIHCLEAEILDEIQTKSLRVFIFSIQSHLYIEISISSNSCNLLQFLWCFTVHYKGERRKN
jgi:hypothetical protein